MLHDYIKKRIHAKWTISSENNPLLPAAEAVEDLVFSFNSCLITIFPEKEEVVLKQLNYMRIKGINLVQDADDMVNLYLKICKQFDE